MPDDPIMDMVNNIAEMYGDKTAMYEKWIEEGDAWDRIKAEKEAKALAGHFSEALSSQYVDEKYSEREIDQAAGQMMAEFADYRDEAIQERVRQVSRKAAPEDLAMDPGDVEHARKYDELARAIGIDRIRELIPVSPQKIRQVLSRGDKHLNSIPLRKWDQAALNLSLRERGLSMSEGVCVLKHVAKWHYA